MDKNIICTRLSAAGDEHEINQLNLLKVCSSESLKNGLYVTPKCVFTPPPRGSIEGLFGAVPNSEALGEEG